MDFQLPGQNSQPVVPQAGAPVPATQQSVVAPLPDVDWSASVESYNYLNSHGEGTYLVKFVKIHNRLTQDRENMLIVDMEVVTSTNDRVPPGMRCSVVKKMGRYPQYYVAVAKAVTQAVMYEKTGALVPAEQITKEHIGRAMEAGEGCQATVTVSPRRDKKTGQAKLTQEGQPFFDFQISPAYKAS